MYNSKFPAFILLIFYFFKNAYSDQEIPVTPWRDECFSQFHQNNFGGVYMDKRLIYPYLQDIKFLLFTCDNKDKPAVFSYLSSSQKWKDSKFQPKAITRIVVHGYGEMYPGLEYKWMEVMKNLFLDKACPKGGINVIGVSWPVPAGRPNYFESADNTQITGQIIGCVINQLKEDLYADPANFHLIGHSLGSHVVGFAGKNVTNPKVGQILATDPAGPGFVYKPNNLKLAYTDADFVQTIHTNGYSKIPIITGLGQYKPLGNLDFYINGGHKQENCDITQLVANLAKQAHRAGGIQNVSVEDRSMVLVCSHVMSNRVASLSQKYVNNNTCQMIAYKCDSAVDFDNGKCGSCGATGLDCRPLQFDLDYWDDRKNWDTTAVQKEYFINTDDIHNEDVCLLHYQLVFAAKSLPGVPCAGTFTVRLSNGKIFEVMYLKDNELANSKDGLKRYTKLHTDKKDLGTITGANIIPNVIALPNVGPVPNVPPIQPTCDVSKIEINFMSHIDPAVRKARSVALCKSGLAFKIC